MTQGPQEATLRFNELVLLTPDIDADIFLHLIPEVRQMVERVTRYASSRDKALAWSKTMHGYPRAGDTNPVKVVAPGVDTIEPGTEGRRMNGSGYSPENKMGSDIGSFGPDPPLVAGALVTLSAD
jgi:hypothetical protein